MMLTMRRDKTSLVGRYVIGEREKETFYEIVGQCPHLGSGDR